MGTRTRDDGLGGPLLNAVMHVGFLVLLAASAVRLLIRHELDEGTVAALELAAVVGLLYSAGVLLWNRAPRPVLFGWLAGVIVCWVALVWAAPSFGFAGIPLLFVALRLLPVAAVVAVAAVLTAATAAAWGVLTGFGDPMAFVVPPALAAMVVGTVVELRREGDRRKRVIADLLRTRDALAESHRRTGVLEERERLAREIHDTVAQGLSSTGMLLCAADLSWESDPERSRNLVRRAAEGVHENLAEARAFVQGGAPAPLSRGTLRRALADLCRSLSEETGIEAALTCDGELDGLPGEVEAALLRVAQGALANVREHSGADRAAVSLARIGDRVTLDVRDDGRGFDPGAPGPGGGRGFGLEAVRARVAGLGGEVTVESAPGEGTGLSVSIPVREDA